MRGAAPMAVAAAPDASMLRLIGSIIGARLNHCRGQFASCLLRPPEQASVNRFRQDMTLNSFHYVGARLESVGRWFHVQLDVQGKKLKHIVMERTVRAGSGAAVHGSSGTDLITSVGQLGSLGYTFG